MYRTSAVRLAVFVALTLADANLAKAQPPAQTNPPQPSPTSPAASSPVPSPQAAADQRINALQAQLRITSTQLPQWNAFAQAMRDNATGTDALFRQRAGAAATMTALENMNSYAQLARAYADNTEALARAFETLYGVLTPEQRQTIDTLFRQQPTQAGATQPFGH
jgi:periplasmic protein CpxP/Spy